MLTVAMVSNIRIYKARDTPEIYPQFNNALEIEVELRTLRLRVGSARKSLFRYSLSSLALLLLSHCASLSELSMKVA